MMKKGNIQDEEQETSLDDYRSEGYVNGTQSKSYIL